MLKDAVKFTNKIKNFDEILSVVLFGSVARGILISILMWILPLYTLEKS
jgi:hypothetical protein